MATRTFADLSQYAAQAAQPTQDPLSALIQGFQLPQQLQDQALQKQLNDLILRQKIADIQNPDAALARQIREQLSVQGALNPTLGIQQAPTGLEGITIQNPGALTPSQQATLPGGAYIPNFVQPTVAAGLPENPIAINGVQTGLNRNLNTIAQAAQDAANQKQQGLQAASDIIQNRQIAVDAAKSGNKKTALVFKDIGDSIVASDPFTGAEVSRIKKDPKAVYRETVNGLYVIPDPSKPTEGSIAPGTGPVTASGGAVPIYNPDGSGEILGYQFPKGFKSNKDLGAGGTDQTPTKQFLNDLSDSALSTIAELKPRISNTTVGVGSYLSNIRGTNASGFDARVKSLAGDIRLGVLAQMKSLSKTGSSGLGQLSNQEGKALESALGSLETSQNPKDFTNSINKIQSSIEKWKAGVEKYGIPESGTTIVPTENTPLIIHSITPVQ